MWTIVLSLLKEILMAVLARVEWKVVAERAFTRLLLWAGDTLTKMTTNTLDDETWAEIRKSLTNKGLKVADETQPETEIKTEVK